MPWRPNEPGEVPTLGWSLIDWFSANLNSPDDADGRPLQLTREQEDFVAAWYAIDPQTGRFRYRRGLIGRARGWGKSPFLGALAIAEGLAEVVFDGWNADGQPVGRPWARSRTPLVHVSAVSEAQTANTWTSMLEMLEGPVIDNYWGLEPLGTFINLPVGKIERITSSSRTIKGARSVFVILDQTEEWVNSNGGRKLAQTVRTNANKVGGRTLESPNAFTPGDESVAEETWAYASAIAEGRATDEGLLYDHREAPGSTDLSDRESLIAGLRYAYGDSSNDPRGCVLHDPPCPPGWADVALNADAFNDPANDVQLLRSDYLNQITHATDAWISRPQWKARVKASPIEQGEAITLGFDGSKGRNRGTADATALIGCRVADGHLFTVRVWEQPVGALGRDWVMDPTQVTDELREAFSRYRVVAFLGDPSGWATQMAEWESEFGPKLKVRAGGGSAIAAWPRGKDSRVEDWVEKLRLAVVNGEVTHDDSPALMRHVLNARRRTTRTGYLLYKAYPDSPDKIDAAYAAMLAWKARNDVISAGDLREPTGEAFFMTGRWR